MFGARYISFLRRGMQLFDKASRLSLPYQICHSPNMVPGAGVPFVPAYRGLGLITFLAGSKAGSRLAAELIPLLCDCNKVTEWRLGVFYFIQVVHGKIPVRIMRALLD